MNRNFWCFLFVIQVFLMALANTISAVTPSGLTLRELSDDFINSDFQEDVERR